MRELGVLSKSREWGRWVGKEQPEVSRCYNVPPRNGGSPSQLRKRGRPESSQDPVADNQVASAREESGTALQSFVFSSLFNDGSGTQGLAHARQVLYH